MIRVELIEGPFDGGHLQLDFRPAMESIYWVPGTNETYGWNGEGTFADKLHYMGVRQRMGS